MILLIVLLLLSFIGFALSLKHSITDNGKITFISKTPEQDRIFKEFAYISGEITSPGIYQISPEMRVSDLIELAGGLTENADVIALNQEINLASKLQDEDHIAIPSKVLGENSLTIGEGSNGSINGLININTASLNELDSLPGIGPSTAQKIIDNRPYTAIEELLDVSGIGNAKFQEIKDLITTQ